MKITNLLKPQSILLNADPVTKADAIYTLGELMDKGGHLTDKAEYLKAVFAREESGSTGLGDGIATPHAKSAGVKEDVYKRQRLSSIAINAFFVYSGITSPFTQCSFETR